MSKPKTRKDFTIHTSYPTDIEKHYINLLTPAQRLAVLVEAGRKHHEQLVNGTELSAKFEIKEEE